MPLNPYILLDKLLQSEEFKMKDQRIKQMEMQTNNIATEIIKQDLAICKGILDIMNGSININSKKNAGTSVKIEIPFEE